MNSDSNRSMKERRYFLIMSHIRENLMNSEADLGTLLQKKDLINKLESKFGNDELTYTLRHLRERGYLDDYDNPGSETYRLTIKGFDEWLFPRGSIDCKKIFLSHASEDKKQAGGLKEELEKSGFIVFVAHDDIPGTEEFRDKMISELETCGIFIALRTAKYCGKSYTEQECGFALALDKKILSLFVGTEPSNAGFCSAFQGKQFKKDENIIEIAKYCKKQLVNLNSNS